jgi:hypothetical protein
MVISNDCAGDGVMPIAQSSCSTALTTPEGPAAYHSMGRVTSSAGWCSTRSTCGANGRWGELSSTTLLTITLHWYRPQHEISSMHHLRNGCPSLVGLHNDCILSSRARSSNRPAIISTLSLLLLEQERAGGSLAPCISAEQSMLAIRPSSP